MIKTLTKFVPKPVRKMINSFLAHPSVHYMRRATRMSFARLFKVYPSTYQVDAVSLMKDYKKCETLFKDSEENFRAIITPYTSEFKWFLGKIYNGAFEAIDVELYYSMVREYRPNLIIEIGPGHSTRFAINAIRKNGTGSIIGIDPEPAKKLHLPRGVEHIQSKVEDVKLSLFKRLYENDMLVIDSSHTTEEATYHVKQILPGLRRGVIIHHHDFPYPYKVYYQNDSVRFGEPDVLINFYMENKGFYEIILAASYARYKNLKLVRELIKSYNWNLARIPGSLWTRKKNL